MAEKLEYTIHYANQRAVMCLGECSVFQATEEALRRMKSTLSEYSSSFGMFQYHPDGLVFLHPEEVFQDAVFDDADVHIRPLRASIDIAEDADASCRREFVAALYAGAHQDFYDRHWKVDKPTLIQLLAITDTLDPSELGSSRNAALRKSLNTRDKRSLEELKEKRKSMPEHELQACFIDILKVCCRWFGGTTAFCKCAHVGSKVRRVRVVVSEHGVFTLLRRFGREAMDTIPLPDIAQWILHAGHGTLTFQLCNGSQLSLYGPATTSVMKLVTFYAVDAYNQAIDADTPHQSPTQSPFQYPPQSAEASPLILSAAAHGREDPSQLLIEGVAADEDTDDAHTVREKSAASGANTPTPEAPSVLTGVAAALSVSTTPTPSSAAEMTSDGAYHSFGDGDPSPEPATDGQPIPALDSMYDAVWSDEHGAYYYIHKQSGEATWTLPQ